MHVFVIDASDEAIKEPPMDLIKDILLGKGGFIKIEPNTSPQKLLWTLRSVLAAFGVGFQWDLIDKLTSKGMHGEQAEHYATNLINELVKIDIPPLPSKEDIEKLREKYGFEQ